VIVPPFWMQLITVLPSRRERDGKGREGKGREGKGREGKGRVGEGGRGKIGVEDR
jgi:hypothetical protein